MEPQGWLIIGTKLDNKQLKKDLANQQRELRQYEKEAESLLTAKTKAESDLEPYQEEISKLKEQVEFYQQMNISEEEKQLSIKRLQPELDAINTKYKEQIDKYNEINNKIKENIVQQDLLKQKVSQTSSQLTKATAFQDINNSIKSIGKGLDRTIKKVVRWGLAIFGIRGAYMAVRSAINVVSQDNETIKADIDYIKSALSYTLAPLVEKIVEWAKQLVFYFGYLIKQWTGHNIFANANEHLKKANKSAKELSKTLQPFDEMNILSESNSSSQNTMPSFDFEEMKAPKWLEDITKYGNWILENWPTVVNTLLGIKLFIDLITGNWVGVAIDLILILIANLIALKETIGDIKDAWGGTWKLIKKEFDKLPDWAKTALKGVANAVIYVLNYIIDKINNFFYPLREIIVGLGKVTGKKYTIDNIKIPKFNYLAKGGIINMPGRGIPIGTAYVGERGQEGVIPLTDSQQMALLGEAIGKYITINANITNTMNGRVISREIQKIQNEQDFAMNR